MQMRRGDEGGGVQGSGLYQWGGRAALLPDKIARDTTGQELLSVKPQHAPSRARQMAQKTLIPKKYATSGKRKSSEQEVKIGFMGQVLRDTTSIPDYNRSNRTYVHRGHLSVRCDAQHKNPILPEHSCTMAIRPHADEAELDCHVEKCAALFSARITREPRQREEG